MSGAFFQKHRKLIMSVFYIVLTVIVGFFAFKYALSWFLPFIIAFVVSRLAEPLVKLLTNRCKIPRNLSSLISIFLFYGIFGTAVYFVFAWLFDEATAFVKDLPAYISTISKTLYAARDSIFNIIDELPGDIPNTIINLIDNFLANFSIPTSTVTSLTMKVTNIAFSLPTAIIFVIVMLVSSYFISSDYQAIKKFILIQMPENVREGLQRTITHLISTLGKWIKAMGIIIVITFAELAIGFSLIGLDYAVIIAIIVAVIDVLPILGVGTVLIPWSLISLVTGDYYMALCMLILYIVITIIRNAIEPKIVGDQIGLHPLVTLICMYVGLQIMGFGGMFLFPIVAITLQKLQEWDYISLWKMVPPEDEEK